jgi:hypothetical protein
MPRVSNGTTTTTKKRKNAKKDENIPIAEPEPIIIQLPINTDTIQNLLETEPTTNPLEYCPNITEPEPYIPVNNFISFNDELSEDNKDNKVMDFYQNIEQPTDDKPQDKQCHKNCCYWCCHSIGIKEFSMPIKYDAYYKTFTTYGHFCSLECIVAYNFATHNGSDRMWEIHSWIQMIAEQIGFETPIRPAPSRYLLKMFNGPLEIEDFRNVHKSGLKTYIMNMPPMIHVPSQMEILNTSYITNKNNITTTDTQHSETKSRLSRKRAVIDMKKTLDMKMNLTIKPIEEV